MIKKKDLFKKKYIGILSPYSFEFINHLIGQLGYFQSTYDDVNVKKEVLQVLRYLFDLEILSVFNWMNNQELVSKNLSIEETINKIDNLWKKGIEYPDFYGIVMFCSRDWYVKKMENLGMSFTTNWESFIEEEIGDLEKWILENKPNENL